MKVSGDPESPVISIAYEMILITLDIPKVLGAIVPGTRDEDQIYNFYYVIISQLSTTFYTELTRVRVLESANCEWRHVCVPFNLLIICTRYDN